MVITGKVVGRTSIQHRSGPMRTDAILGMTFPSAASFSVASSGGGDGRDEELHEVIGVHGHCPGVIGFFFGLVCRRGESVSRGGGWWLSTRVLVVVGLVVRKAGSVFFRVERWAEVRLTDNFKLEGFDPWCRG